MYYLFIRYKFRILRICFLCDSCVSCNSELTSHSFVCLFLPLNKRQLLLFYLLFIFCHNCNNHKINYFVISEINVYISQFWLFFSELQDCCKYISCKTSCSSVISPSKLHEKINNCKIKLNKLYIYTIFNLVVSMLFLFKLVSVLFAARMWSFNR